MSTSRLLAAVLSEKAREQGTTIKAIGEKLGLSGQVANWLKGTAKIEEIPAETLDLFAKELNTTVDALKIDMNIIIDPTKKTSQKDKSAPKKAETPKKESSKKESKSKDETPAKKRTKSEPIPVSNDSDDIPGQMTFGDTEQPTSFYSLAPSTQKRTTSKINENKVAMDSLVADVKDNVASLEKSLKALYSAANSAASKTVDKRYEALLKAAEGSTDEGIEFAIKILKKWKK
jgi:hypothetical protein